MANKIQLRRDTAANWTAANPVLAQGEPGIELDTGHAKYGDGVKAWKALPYAGADTFLQDGANAKSRSISDKLKDALSVRDFGAVGNGTTDDTAAIQAALDAAVAQKKPLHFGGGTFYHASPVVCTVAVADGRVRIMLDGARLKAGALAVAAFNIKGGTFRPPVTIEGPGRFDGSNLIVNAGVASGSYVNIENCDQVLVDGVEFDAGPRSAGKGDSGLVVSSCGDAKVVGCGFRGWNDHGIYFTGAAIGHTQTAVNAVVSGCTFRDLSGAIRWARSASDLVVDGNVFKDVYNGVIIAGGNSNWNPGDTVSVTGNMFDGCDSSAIDARYFDEGILITGNSIYDTGKKRSAAAINLRGVSRSIISGNIISTKDPGNTPATDTRCAVGIYMAAATNTDLAPPDNSYVWPAEKNMIIGNFFHVLQSDVATGGRNAAIVDMAGGGSNVYVNNMIKVEGSAIEYYVNSGVSNVALGSPWILHPSANGFGIGTNKPESPLHVIGDLRVGRKDNTTHYIVERATTGVSQVWAHSSPSAAVRLFLNATTDASHTAPTGGAIGLNLRVLNVDKVSCNVNDVQMGAPLKLKEYPTTGLPTTGIARGTIAYDATTSTVKFYNGTAWADI